MEGDKTWFNGSNSIQECDEIVTSPEPAKLDLNRVPMFDNRRGSITAPAACPGPEKAREPKQYVCLQNFYN